MPWKIVSQEGRYCVVKSDDGSTVKCHDSESDAKAHMSALYANEKTADKAVPPHLVSEETAAQPPSIGVEEKADKHYSSYYVPWGVTDFDALDDYLVSRETAHNMERTVEHYNQLLSNIMGTPDVDKAAAIRRLSDQLIDRLESASSPAGRSFKDTLKSFLGLARTPGLGGSEEKQRVFKMENGLNFPANDYAYVPDPQKPATWKMRLTEAPGKISKSQLGRAALALSPGGQKVEIPPKALSSVKRRIRAEYRKLGVAENEIPMSVKASFALEKQADGSFRFRAIYSNNYRDDDKPAEIISEKSHQTFADMVKAGIVPPPELLIWHIPKARFGVADHVDCVDGFAIATGTVDKGMEHVAQSLAAMDDLAMSHGMPSRFIKRDPADPTVITNHITREISVLPRWAAANKLTGFLLSKEQTMALSDSQKEFLRQAKYTDADIAELETGIKQMAEAGEERERKGADAPLTPPEAETPAEDKAAVPALSGRADEDLKKEIADVLKETVLPIAQMMKVQHERLGALEASIKELQVSDAAKIAKTKEETPALSLKELMAQMIVGADEARISGNTALGKDKPKQSAPNVSGIPFLDKMMAGMGE